MEVISSNRTETNTIETEFKVNGEEFEKAVQTAFLKKKSKISIPGFRKGKATRKMIEKQYGENFFYEDAINGMYQKSVSDVIETLGADVVDIPNIEVLSVNKDDGVSFKASLTVRPDSKITGYLGIEVSEEDNTVTDTEIDNRIEELRNKSARIIDITDSPTEMNDTVVFDFKGSLNGEYFDGGSGEKFSLELGSHKFIPGFEEQLTGKNIGEDFNVNMTFPDDYNASELAGKEAVFECYIHEIKRKELAELDDEFSKDVSEFDTLDELKQDLKDKIAEEKEEAGKKKLNDEVTQKLQELLEAEIPPIMIEHRIDELIRNWEFNNKDRGITMTEYIKYTNSTEEAFRNLFRQLAEQNVRFRLALEKIAQLENIEISEDKIEEEYKKLSSIYNMDIEKVKKVIPEKEMRKDLSVDRALEIVKENVKRTKVITQISETV